MKLDLTATIREQLRTATKVIKMPTAQYDRLRSIVQEVNQHLGRLTAIPALRRFVKKIRGMIAVSIAGHVEPDHHYEMGEEALTTKDKQLIADVLPKLEDGLRRMHDAIDGVTPQHRIVRHNVRTVHTIVRNQLTPLIS